MAFRYSSLYESLPQKPSVFSPKAVAVRVAEMAWRARFIYTIPAGVPAADVIRLGSIFANIAVAVPQIAGLRCTRFVLRSSGNVGGAMTFNLGTAATPTLFGTALTTLQSATVLDVAVAVLMPALFLGNDDFQMVLAAGPTTTQQTIDGWYDLDCTAP